MKKFWCVVRHEITLTEKEFEIYEKKGLVVTEDNLTEFENLHTENNPFNPIAPDIVAVYPEDERQGALQHYGEYIPSIDRNGFTYITLSEYRVSDELEKEIPADNSIREWLEENGEDFGADEVNIRPFDFSVEFYR